MQEAVSFAVKHRTLGEDVGVAVILKPSAAATESELRSFVAERLAAFKVPQTVRFVGRIPRNVVGKIDRLALSKIVDAQRESVGPTGSGSEMEEQIAQIWADELNLPAVGVDDNFFAIGGESLSGVRVFLAVEKAFGKPLPVSVLTGITTVREMARLIEAAEGALPEPEADETEGRLTVTEKRSIAAVMAMGGIPVARPGSAFKAVNTGGSRTPLFWCFNSPAKEMGGLAPRLDPEQPLYGLYSGGWLFPKTDVVRSKIAEFYAEEIVALVPDGPYVIGGNCGGSKLALKIVRILRESGRRVEKICLLEHSSDILDDVDGQALLHDFDGPVLLLFGKQSKLRAYRAMRWGRAGWRTPFRRPPAVEWVSGSSGRYFRSYNVASLTGKLDRFLQDRSQDGNPLARIEPGIIMAIHRIPVLFYMYKKVFKLRDRVLYGKKGKMNPFTGEPLT